MRKVKVKVNKGTLAKLLMFASISPNKGNVERYEKTYYNLYKDLEKTLSYDEMRSLVNSVDDETIKFAENGGHINE